MKYYLLKKNRKTGKPVFHVRFQSEDLDENGQRRVVSQRSTGQTSAAAAHDQVKEWIRRGEVSGTGGDLLAYLRDFWDPDVSPYLKERERTQRPYNRNYLASSWKVLEQVCIPYFAGRGVIDLNGLNRKNIAEWLQHLHDREDVTARVANRARQALFTALRYAADVDQVIPFHPGHGVRPTREPASKRRPFSQAEMVTLLTKTTWTDERARVACALAFDTGMRLGECRGLLWSDVDLKAGTVMVRHNFVDCDGLKKPKSGRERGPIEISQYTVAGLRELEKLSSAASGAPEYVFFGVEGSPGPCSSQVLTNGLRKACMEAKIDTAGKSFHSLRHTAISIWGPMMSPADRLTYFGHSDLEVQSGYTHRTAQGATALRKKKNTVLVFKKTG